MGALMRAHNWAVTPLGPPQGWPQSLKAMVGAVLNTPQLGTILWGPELRMLYNDGYIPSMADRHPHALGAPVSEVWGEVWELVAPAFHQAMKDGKGFMQHHVELPMVRNNRHEVTYWNISATPIRGDDGQIAGLLNLGSEITKQVYAEQEREQALAKLRILNSSLEEQVAQRTAARNRLWTMSADLMLVASVKGVAYSGDRDRSFRLNVTVAHEMVLRDLIVISAVTMGR